MNQPGGKRIVVVDDDPIFLEYLAAVLTQNGNFRVLQITNPDDVFPLLRNDPHIASVVIDYDLGSDTGLTLGKAIKERFSDPPPIVMLTGQGSETTAVKAFRIGFSDYVSKRDLDKSELIRALNRAIARREDDLARNAEAAKLRTNSRFDDLTGLHAIGHVEARLREMRFRRLEKGFSLFVIRPRHLEQIKNSLGYVVAEKLLRSFANRLREATADAALCGHLSTEEFICVYEERTSPEQVRNTCERLSQLLELTEEQSRLQLRVEAIIGAAVFPEDGDTADKVKDAALSSMDLADKLGIRYSSTILPNEPSEKGHPAAAAMTALDEQRSEPRKRVLKRGKIIVSALNSVIDCTVRDVSPSGAHLRVDNYFQVPERFKLQIVGSGNPREVEKRWQVGADLGVEFKEQ